MDVGPLELGGPALVIGGLLAVLGVIVVTTLLVVVMWAVALTVVAPTMGTAAASAHRWRRHRWFRHVRESWLADPGDTDPPETPDRQVRGVAVVSAHDAGARCHLVAAQVADTTPGAGSAYSPMTMVHASLEPSARLELPAHPSCCLMVYVLAGRGTVGPNRWQVCAGQVVVLPHDTPISVVASPHWQSPPLAVLVVGKRSAARAADGPVVLGVDDRVRRRIGALRALTDDLPKPQTETVVARIPTAVPAA